MPAGYYRFPTIHDDTVVFVSEDDLWTVPAAGGIARRLTANLGAASRPSFSPDGSQIAFVGREEGTSEIYLMPAHGGPARRITYLGSPSCTTAGWTREGEIIFASSAQHWYSSATQLYAADISSGLIRPLPYGLAHAIAIHPGGAVVLGRNTNDPARWKRYRGGTVGRLWIDPTGSGEFHPLIKLPGNLASPMWIGDRIFFISDHEGIGNLYSCNPEGEDLRRETNHTVYYARHASTDGKRIVYHSGADLYIFDPHSGENRMIEVDYHSPRVQRNRRFVDAARYLSHWSIHPKGQAMAIETRGKIFSFANWEGAVRQHRVDPADAESASSSQNGAVTTGVRCRLPTWLNDGKRLIGITDQGGEEYFMIWQADGSEPVISLEGLDIGRPESIRANPKKDQIAFSNHRYELFCLDLNTRELKRIDRGKASPIAGFDWSPDGEWLAYSVSISLSTMALKLWQASTGEIYPLTESLLRDVAPSFDPKGRYLYFLSYRSFDPVYDNVQFDLSFPRAMKPYLITLQKDLESPFIPKPRLDTGSEEETEEEKPQEQEAGMAAEQTNGSKDGAGDSAGEEEPEKTQEKKEGEEALRIDLDGIQQRVIAFPVTEGIYGRVIGLKNDKVLYSRYPVEGAIARSQSGNHNARGSLLVYNFQDQREETLVNNITDFDVSSDRSMMVYRADNRLRVLKAGEKPSDDGSPSRKSGWLNLGRVKVSVNPGAEWRQMFREAWRLQRDQFWTPDMAQVDWVSVHDRYLPLVDRVSCRSEFSDLMWEMQGELGTSHAYELGGDYRPEPNYQQGFLGADFEYEPESDAWRITRIYQGDSWDPQNSSPLSQPGVQVREGDRLVEVNGQRLSRSVSPAAALVNLAGEEVTLTILPQSDGDQEPAKSARTVTVKTLRSEIGLRYRDWVENNRRRVHDATGGRIGYLHIPDMGPQGYAEFHRGFLSEIDREGLIVDVRYNRGGHVSSLLLEKLARKRLGYDLARWSEIPTPYPVESVLGPIVALTNEYAGSDGDIFSHGFKAMGLGPLIGKRTWGGVIGIWPRHSLVDGTQTTQPEFSFWFNDVGWGVENYGVDPDIEVDIRPQDYVRGVDPQLERAIEEILRLLAENPPQLPDFSERPTRALPTLKEL